MGILTVRFFGDFINDGIDRIVIMITRNRLVLVLFDRINISSGLIEFHGAEGLFCFAVDGDLNDPVFRTRRHRVVRLVGFHFQTEDKGIIPVRIALDDLFHRRMHLINTLQIVVFKGDDRFMIGN